MNPADTLTDADLPLANVQVVTADPSNPQIGDIWIVHYDPGDEPGHGALSSRLGDSHNQPLLAELPVVNDYTYDLLYNVPYSGIYFLVVAPSGIYATFTLGPNEFVLIPANEEVNIAQLGYGEGTTYQQIADYLNSLTAISSEPWVFVDEGYEDTPAPTYDELHGGAEGNASWRSTVGAVPAESFTLKVKGETTTLTLAGSLEA